MATLKTLNDFKTKLEYLLYLQKTGIPVPDLNMAILLEKRKQALGRKRAKNKASK